MKTLMLALATVSLTALAGAPASKAPVAKTAKKPAEPAVEKPQTANLSNANPRPASVKPADPFKAMSGRNAVKR